MSKESTTTRSGGISALSLLGVVFVTLKLLGITDVATWSWWYVTMPFWGLIALLIIGFMIYAAFLVIAAGVKHLTK